MDGVPMTRPVLDLPILGQVDPAAISIRAGFDSNWDDPGDRSGMGRSLLQGACCFIFCELYGVSACWYFCWYRQQLKTKITVNSNGYGTRRLSARGTRLKISAITIA
jgi:hypothetical protein